jgi:exodeoxyribonuclease VII large subunit
VLKRRYPVDILLSPATVQGDASAESIVDAIEKLNRTDVDVIIVGRGGGSMEDLWSFNEEIVARAISCSRIPIVSAVGHETDFTIADFTADLRAPTPSAAAELVVPDVQSLKRHIEYLSGRMIQAAIHTISDNSARVDYLQSRIEPDKLSGLIRQNSQRVDELAYRMERAVRGSVESKISLLSGFAGRLNTVSPLKTLERGYSIASKSVDNALIRSIDDVSEGDDISIIVKDGRIGCKVDNVSWEQF